MRLTITFGSVAAKAATFTTLGVRNCATVAETVMIAILTMVAVAVTLLALMVCGLAIVFGNSERNILATSSFVVAIVSCLSAFNIALIGVIT